ncbi:hypothetical protein BUALT_Bualt18G0018600 [Buddleja alternifolia]|uniref:Uncharacterized protein n=1 Tax=Buddleja alternifolia TaxID=168488 RepID=A0AAV6W872_9LAMI|nr:hypothetical protein BUALT_Bualt18G0018600 [Buddleja alternifolia]
MPSSMKITVVERCSISPPPHSVAASSLPLTFLDIPWLLFSPTKPLFFYNFPISTAHFIHSILPNLKHSLSLTLQHFFPLAGNFSPSAAEPSLEYTENDSICLTVTEAAAAAGEFSNLAGDHSRPARDFNRLVPVLKNETDSKESLLSIQITVFPESGICMGFTLRHVVADGRTFNNFLRTWASLTKSGEIMEIDQLLAFHDRLVIRDPIGLKSKFLKELWNIKVPQKGSIEANGSTYDMLRATFVMSPQEMEKIKKWILTRSEKLFGSTQLLLSPYVLTCAFVWVCWMKTHWSTSDEYDESIHYFGFIAGGITRLDYVVPNIYVGNCVGFGRSEAKKTELMGENGLAYAGKAIGDAIKKLNKDLLGGAENWISEWKALRESELHVMVTGSPKVGSYGLDFGWGKPMKIEEVSIGITGAISLCEGREVVGSIEIGLALPQSKMDAFSTLFNKELETSERSNFEGLAEDFNGYNGDELISSEDVKGSEWKMRNPLFPKMCILHDSTFCWEDLGILQNVYPTSFHNVKVFIPSQGHWIKKPPRDTSPYIRLTFTADLPYPLSFTFRNSQDL